MLNKWRYVLLSLLFCTGCDNSSGSKLKMEPGESMLGGETTHFVFSNLAFNLRAANMKVTDVVIFELGDSSFNASWQKAPGTDLALDGLGPLFNATSCLDCHQEDGRGRPPEAGQQPETLLFRLSIPDPITVISHRFPVEKKPRRALLPLASFMGSYTMPALAAPVASLNNVQFATLPEANYGGQMHPRSTDAGVPVEATVSISYTEIPGTYADGSAYSLRDPNYVFNDLGYGAMDGDILVSPRTAPHLVGMGLLEAITEADILALADENDSNGDGISGRANYVNDVVNGGMSLGRFGWKSNVPSVRQQVAGAFNGDIGITSSLFPNENHTAIQTEAAAETSGGAPELSELKLDRVTFYTQMIGVPGRRDADDETVLQGRELFRSMKCTACHVEKHTTGNTHPIVELRNQKIRPFTDLLVHDMGDGLADERPDGDAGTHEWRTPPLWGIGLFQRVNNHTLLMHDGRARGFAEAILWHGGEGEDAKEAFRTASKKDRDRLIAYLETL